MGARYFAGDFPVSRILIAAVAAALGIAAATAVAQTYPARAVKLVVPFPPGGPTDVVGRFVATRLGEAFGQQFVVENRAGAGGTVGSEAVAQAAPDGYTLLYGSTSTLAMAPSLYRKLGYDPRKSFAPVSLVSSGPLLVAVNAAVPAQTLAQLIALAKEKPGALNYGSAGNATPPHLAAELFKSLSGTNLTHVPYKGGAPALQAVTGGEVQVIFEGLVTLLPQIKAGKLRALAITGTARDPALPETPTIAEAGLPAFQVNFWSGLVAPAGTPPDVVNALNAALRKALAAPEARDALARFGLVPLGNSPAEFARFIDTEIARWEKAVQASGAKVD
ncbi:MAG: tripartite tricarboxylate transporter substrate binding protein [Burkholderiales bacterium]|nr:tripartite tricarboxylate transporter substrate binding protein [Burkholderiales bacterium]